MKQIGVIPWRKKSDRMQILLITSRETRRWVVPKGWPMDHLIDSNAAKREAFEEAGVEGRTSRTALGSYDYDKRLSDGRMLPCKVEVYPLEVLQQHGKWPEHKQRKRRWFAPEEAAWEVDEPGLKDIIRKFAGGS